MFDISQFYLPISVREAQNLPLEFQYSRHFLDSLNQLMKYLIIGDFLCQIRIAMPKAMSKAKPQIDGEPCLL
jgi:hypothetical protein